MKLSKIITLINQNEISKFYKILTTIIDEVGENVKLDKKTDAENFVRTFNKEEISKRYKKHLLNEISSDLVLDLIVDILIRDGNIIMSRDWFNELVKREVKRLKDKIKEFSIIDTEEAEKVFEKDRLKTYRVYYQCVKTAFDNDLTKNQSQKVTNEELTILNTLRKAIELSNEDARAIYFLVVDVKILNNIVIQEWIEKICSAGVGFYKKTEMNIYIPEEILFLLREIKNKRIADKNSRRILKCLDDKTINRIKRKYGVKAVDRSEKIEEIIKNGVDIESILKEDIYEESMSIAEKKKHLQDIVDQDLEIHLEKTGRTIDEKLDFIFDYFNNIERDTSIGISKDGYERMIDELIKFDKTFEKYLRLMYEIEDKVRISADTLLDYNIKPRDILYLLSDDQLKEFCDVKRLSWRGKNKVNVVVASFAESESLIVENYTLIAKNDINSLKNNGIDIKSDRIGIEFENATKTILSRLRFNVDEELRGEVNSKKEKADIVINLGNKELIVGECKAHKTKYTNFSSVIRQVKSYVDYYTKKGFLIKGCVIFSGEFSEDFINDSLLFSDFNLTLWDASTLYNVYEEFVSKKKELFPVNLFLRQGLIQEDVTIKAINK